MNFQTDLKQGQLGERIVAKWLETKNFEIIDFSDTKDYDIRTRYKDKEVLFEVKTDLYEYYKKRMTNNLFIEVSCNGVASGISSSKSHIFAYYLPIHNKLYMIYIKKLKQLIQENPYAFHRTSQSGDGGRVNGYLIDRIEYEHYFNVYDITLKRFPFK